MVVESTSRHMLQLRDVGNAIDGVFVSLARIATDDIQFDVVGQLGQIVSTGHTSEESTLRVAQAGRGARIDNRGLIRETANPFLLVLCLVNLFVLLQLFKERLNVPALEVACLVTRVEH